jgi:fused-like protein
MDAYDSLCDIGHGSFGRVVKARHRLTNELVALKIIPKHGKSSADIQALRNECDIQRKLNHPNIVRMLNAFETREEMVVVTEFVPGLLTKLHEKYAFEGVNRMPEARVQRVATDLLSALYYLHCQRILHRDIKVRIGISYPFDF